jgi:hypothetical protein
MPSRHPFAKLIPLLAVLALGACTSGAELTDCGSDDQCPTASRCGTGVCVADGRPLAAIRAVAPVAAYTLVELDGTDSGDPDAGDEIVEHLWTIRPVTARCAAPEVAGSSAVARVRFGCPGRYEVSLSVRDGLGVESAPAIVEAEVLPASGTPVVVAGPDASTDHACSGEPLVCRPLDPVLLTATTAVPGLTLRWTVEPPLDRPLEDGTRRVRLEPAGTSVEAVIETDGTAISGDWIFRVEALDGYGVVGAAYTRVSVRNRPPVVVADTPAPFPHAFDRVRSRFFSSGEIAWSAWDPDGDPVETSATWRHLGDGGAVFRGGLGSGKATFTVDVPYGAPEHALHLRGGPALARAIELFARDPNRGEGRASVPIDIGNRPPELISGTVDVRVPHAFDALRSRYVARAQLGAWSDPDGDPLSAARGEAPCQNVTVVDGEVEVECSVAYGGKPAVDQLAGRRPVSVRVRDPWTDAAGTALYTLDILNGAPTLAFETNDVSLPYWTTSQWLDYPILNIGAGTFTVFPEVKDPEGDPVELTATIAPGGSVTPSVAVCTSPDCVPFLYAQPQLALRYPYTPPNQLRASDGAASALTGVSPPLYPR